MHTTTAADIPCILTISGENETAFLYRISEQIYKLDMPPITSIFLIRKDNDWYFVDSCKNTLDVEQFVLPAAKHLALDFDHVRGILITHSHWDHTDGLPALLPLCPNAVVYAYYPTNISADSPQYQFVTADAVIDDFIKVVSISGHSEDCLGFIDTRSSTLFSGDAIQLYGISTCGMFIFNGVDNYMDSLRKLLTVDIDNILGSHPYVPNGAFALGKEQSVKHIRDSIDCIAELIDFTKELCAAGCNEPSTIKKRFIEHKSDQIADFPTDGFDAAIESVLSVCL